MTSVTARSARAKFAELMNRVAFGHERIAIDRNGKKIAVLVSVEDAELLERLEDEIDVELAKKALKEKGRIPYEQVRKELGLK